MRSNGRGSSPYYLAIVFVSLMATVFVGERLLQLTRQISLLETQLHDVVSQRRSMQRALLDVGIKEMSELKKIKMNGTAACEKDVGLDCPIEIPFIDVKPATLEDVSGKTIRVDEEDVKTVGADDDNLDMPPILGQIDLIEDGYISGWACEKGIQEKALQVKIFINDALLGFTTTNGRALHPLVDRICAGPSNIGTDGEDVRNVAFKYRLPRLHEGLFTVRAFVYSTDGHWRKELNSSPQRFVESSSQPGLSDAIKRKDAIIRARNAQVAALYEQLHSRGIWHKAVNFERVRSFDRTKTGNRYLAFVGLISNSNDIHSRDLQRKVWVPTGSDREKKEQESGIIVRFVIGKSDWMTETEMADLRKEQNKHKDIVIVDMRGFEDPAKKALAFFSGVAFQYDVDFVFKADKETLVDIEALAHYLKPLKTKGNLYMGCMKSGEVVRSARERWHEPEHWKFGDPQGSDRKINYPRHAQRQFLGVSQLVARYLAQNADVLHYYANDDVSIGVWLLGLEVQYTHEPRLCCLEKDCEKYGSDMDKRCIGYFETACSGLCRADVTIKQTYESCIKQSVTR